MVFKTLFQTNPMLPSKIFYDFPFRSNEHLNQRGHDSKGHQYGYQMKGLGLGCNNMLFIFRFPYLFTFCKHKQQFVYI
jgi:hypothetical protein